MEAHWRDDAVTERCELCLRKFTLVFNRRHHCRDCGGVFCGKCCEATVAMPHRGFFTRVRVCALCFPTAVDREKSWGPQRTDAPYIDDIVSSLAFPPGETGVSAVVECLLENPPPKPSPSFQLVSQAVRSST